MKVTNLMCGDIVHLYVNDNGITNEDVKVRYAGENFVNIEDKFGIDDEFIEDDDVEGVSAITPVFISDTILESFGFRIRYESEYRTKWEMCDSNEEWIIEYTVSKQAIDNNFLRIYVDCNPVVQMRVSEVHLLQHALRLCGLVELANNLKVC